VALPAGRDEGRIATIAAALLVGGASSRMGRDKSRLEIGGVANATRLARLLGGLFEELLLVGGDPPDDAPGRCVPDPEGPVCALRGLVAALEAARAPRVLVVATDLPLLTADLVLALVAWPESPASNWRRVASSCAARSMPSPPPTSGPTSWPASTRMATRSPT